MTSKGTLFLLGISFFLFDACYSFKAASIPVEIESFYVEEFDNKTTNSLPILQQLFTEKLKNKILNESRLTFNDVDPDIEFSGSISGYRISSVAPEVGSVAAFNRLEITVSVTFDNNLNEDASWEQRFSFFENYERDVNINDIQEDLIDTINDQLVEDIFNKAFTSW